MNAPSRTGESGAIVVIPARMAATRLPGKPLASIAGQPMIVHVWRRAVAAAVGPVIVAAAETEIADAIIAAGGEAVLTDPGCPSGSDRVFQAVERFDPARRFEIVVNLQGDMPSFDPGLLRRALSALDQPGVDIATAVCPTEDQSVAPVPSVVKAAVEWRADTRRPNRLGRALYFSRNAIPSGAGALNQHLGLYAYRRDALARFVALPQSELEKGESLEQLRALAAGMRIDVAEVDSFPLGIDTPEDLALMREMASAGKLGDLSGAKPAARDDER